MSQGLWRGALPLFPIAFFEMQRIKSARKHGLSNADTVFGFSLFTFLLHPLTVMQTKKQIITNEQSYSQMMKLGPRLFTLGIGSTLLRNFTLSTAFMPRFYGVHD